jgi:hypothetical protein
MTAEEIKKYIFKEVGYEFISKDGKLMYSKRFAFLPENRKIMLSLRNDPDFKGHLMIDEETNEFYLRRILK